jgi:hypothetical protein
MGKGEEYLAKPEVGLDLAARKVLKTGLECAGFLRSSSRRKYKYVDTVVYSFPDMQTPRMCRLPWAISLN